MIAPTFNTTYCLVMIVLKQSNKLLFWKESVITSRITKKVIWREKVVVPNLNNHFGWNSLLSHVQAPKMRLMKKKKTKTKIGKEKEKMLVSFKSCT